MGAMCTPRGEDSGQLNRQVMRDIKQADTKGIQCHSLQLLSQGKRCGNNRMEDLVTRTFSTVRFWWQEESLRSKEEKGEGLLEKKEGGKGGSRPFHTVYFSPASAPGSKTSRDVAVGIDSGIRSVVVQLCASEVSPADESSFFIVVAVCGSIGVLNSLQVGLGHPLSSSTLASYQSNTMAPRLRATPRRGCNYGQRGGSGGRGSQSPRRISPLAFASPPSTRSEDSGHSISNTVQSARFQFRRRTNKPLISALVTVIFSEEDEEDGSSKEASEKQTPSPSDNSSQRRWMEDSSYAPLSQSKLDQESTFVHSAEQAEVLQEIGSLKDKEILDTAQQKAEAPQEMEDIRQASPHKQTMDEEPDNSFANILYLKLPPGMKPEDVKDGVEVTWERAPDKETGKGSENLK